MATKKARRLRTRSVTEGGSRESAGASRSVRECHRCAPREAARADRSRAEGAHADRRGDLLSGVPRCRAEEGRQEDVLRGARGASRRRPRPAGDERRIEPGRAEGEGQRCSRSSSSITRTRKRKRCSRAAKKILIATSSAPSGEQMQSRKRDADEAAVALDLKVRLPPPPHELHSLTRASGYYAARTMLPLVVPLARPRDASHG